MEFTKIITVGPGLIDNEKLNAISSFGNVIFRLNGAHLNATQAKDMIASIKKFVSSASVMIDLPGNKVRTGILPDGIRLVNGQTFSLNPGQLNFPDFYKYLKVGDIVYANDAIFKLEVQTISDGVIPGFRRCWGCQGDGARPSVDLSPPSVDKDEDSMRAGGKSCFISMPCGAWSRKAQTWFNRAGVVPAECG